ncbi:MAG: uroporphyrinogen decarboxylase [Anaerolineae bacterium]|nr:MAG: uroporphyrinogen decarboxylase [Anaerolineae bacterium]
MMDKWERIQAALHGAPVDQAPLALWRHFHGQDRNPATLAQLTVDFARRYDLDLVKLTPSGLYAVEDWGAEIVFPAGRDVNSPGTETEPPYLARPAIADPEGWRMLRQRGTAALDRELEAVRLTRHELGRDWPMVMTIFSPLTLAYKLAGEGLTDHLCVDPEAVHVGLRALTPVTTAFAHAALDVGADGLFFASQWICAGFCTREQYEEFGLEYDLEVLEAISHRSRVTVLHLHGTDIFFDLAEDYPVDALSWHDRETPPSLAEARQQTDLALVAGLDRDLLRTGPPEAIAAQVRDAIAQTGGRGLILAPACVMAPDTPEAHLRAAVDVLTG